LLKTLTTKSAGPSMWVTDQVSALGAVDRQVGHEDVCATRGGPATNLPIEQAQPALVDVRTKQSIDEIEQVRVSDRYTTGPTTVCRE
jgi:hypothetical protein